MDELDKNIAILDNADLTANIAKASDGKYVIYFSGKEPECVHAKHVTIIEGYTFVFCKKSKDPIALYCTDEIVSSDGALEMIKALADSYTLLAGLGEGQTGNARIEMLDSPYFKALANTVINTKSIQIIDQ